MHLSISYSNESMKKAKKHLKKENGKFEPLKSTSQHLSLTPNPELAQ